MRSERVDELLLVKYLLGNLTEDEEVRVEDRAFADPEYLGALQGAETDLIDAYVRGELAQAERRAFERRFLTSPERRGKVEFARTLATVAAELTPLTSPSPKPASTWQMLLALLRGSSPALRFAGAFAALISIVGASWLVFENGAMRARLSALEAQRHASEVREQGLKQELSQAQNRADSLATQMQGRPSEEARPASLIASLVLLPGLSRAETRVPELVLVAGAQIAHIEVQLDARDDYPRFRADLRTRSGREILALANLRARQSGAARSVSMDVPASALDAGEYELALKGLSVGDAVQDIGYYYFRVQKR